MHPERDQDLLLLAHGALPPLKTALTRLHLARCPECRQRLDQFQAASLGLAATIRGSQRPQWSLPAAGTPLGASAAWLIAAAILAVILLGTLAVRGRQHLPIRPPASAGSFPCRPDLPSDRCR